LAQIAPELDALVAQLEAQEERPWFYVGSDWLLPWAELGNPDADIFVATLRGADGQLEAALPVARQMVRLGSMHTLALTILGWPVTDNFEVPARSDAARQELLRAFWAHARREISGWTCWMLREVDEDGPTVAALEQCARGGMPEATIFPVGKTPVLDLDAFADDGDPRTKKQLYRITKFRRKLAKAGEVETPFWLVQPDEVDAVWDNAVDVESRSWKGEDGDATSLQDGSKAAALKEIWRRTASEGRLACAEVRLDGRVLASHWGFVTGRRFYSFHMAYDNDYRSYGLGSVMLEDMIQQSPSLGLRWFDASRGNPEGTHILRQYGTPFRQHVQVVVPHPGLRGLKVRVQTAVRYARMQKAARAAQAEGAATS
jgi:hypothetical protein